MTRALIDKTVKKPEMNGLYPDAIAPRIRVMPDGNVNPYFVSKKEHL